MPIKHDCFEHLLGYFATLHLGFSVKLVTWSHRVAFFSNLDPDRKIILSLRRTWFINPNPTSKSSKKMAAISKNLSKTVQNRSKSVQKSKKCWSYSQNLAHAKKCGIYLPNPTAGVPRCRNNLQLCLPLKSRIMWIKMFSRNQDS